MPSLWFVMPVHGRLPLATICLRQLRRTCDQLANHGIEATAVVIADRRNLRHLRELDSLHGFGTIERDNEYLSRRFNDGYQFACDPEFNPRPADYAVPIGSDDWIDHRILTRLPAPDTVLGFQHCSFVSPDGTEMMSTFLRVDGGCGIRVYPRQVLEATEYRPAAEDLSRGCDTSTLNNTRQSFAGLKIEHREIDPRQIVDWKSPDQQVTPYERIWGRHRGEKHVSPFDQLADLYPRDSLDEMAAIYETRQLVAS
jgi:hypothetical protein